MNFANLLARFLYDISEPILAPFRWINDQFQESPRKRALVYGLPAVLVACVGVALITAAQIRRERELLAFYNQSTSRLDNEILKQVNLLNSSRQLINKSAVPKSTAAEESEKQANESRATETTVEASSNELTAEQQEIVQRIQTLQSDLQTMLLKLISLDPVNKTYRFRYANSFGSTDPMKQFELMRQLAPETNPGFAEAHFWLASIFIRARANTANERRIYNEKALIHANFCLNLDSRNREARIIKANALAALGRQQEAYGEFETLFKEEPEFFDSLVRINKTMSLEGRNRAVYEDAARRLENKLRVVRDTDVDAWSRTLRQIQLCHIGSQNFVELRRLLIYEQVLAQQNPLRKKAVDEVLGSSLNAEAQALVRSDFAAQKTAEILKLLKQSYELLPNDVQTKYLLTYLTTTFPETTVEARAIYNPDLDPDIPGQVLQVLGNAEMQKRNYSEAIERYEQARLKIPKDSDLLNNLAFAYLVSDTKNAERALFLVDEAIQLLPNSIETNDAASHFHHTRGTALLSLNRVSEAAASFELALQYRPDNVGILESLIKCYTGRDEKQAAAFRKRLDAVIQKGPLKLP